MNVKHDCNNDICRLLNPCLTDLLAYEELKNRVTKVGKLFHDNIREFIKMSYPLDLWGWASQHMMFQLPNLEFVQELAKVIKEINPETTLEIAAGRGIISRHISKIIDKDIILTDDYSWWRKEKVDEKIEYADVIKMDYKEAIKKFQPDLIIASWIPYNKFWTKDFRRYSCVKGYILIGEYPGGCTGHENDWNTVWTRRNLEAVEKYGICRTDISFSSDSYALYHTNVTYFERPSKGGKWGK